MCLVLSYACKLSIGQSVVKLTFCAQTGQLCIFCDYFSISLVMLAAPQYILALSQCLHGADSLEEMMFSFYLDGFVLHKRDGRHLP